MLTQMAQAYIHVSGVILAKYMLWSCIAIIIIPVATNVTSTTILLS